MKLIFLNKSISKWLFSSSTIQAQWINIKATFHKTYISAKSKKAVSEIHPKQPLVYLFLLFSVLMSRTSSRSTHAPSSPCG